MELVQDNRVWTFADLWPSSTKGEELLGAFVSAKLVENRFPEIYFVMILGATVLF